MPNNKEILQGFVDTLKTDVINSMQAHGRYASGKTAREITTNADDNASELSAPEYIDKLEDGRGPTSPGAPAGDPTVFEQIKAWCAIRGIDEKAAYPIAKSIHKYGYKGKPGVLTEPLGEDNINNRLNNTLEQLADNEVDSFLESLGI